MEVDPRSPRFPHMENLNGKVKARNSAVKVTRAFAQEKLDGCNFRLSLEQGPKRKARFGTRNVDLEPHKDFRQYHVIKDSLLKSLGALAGSILKPCHDYDEGLNGPIMDLTVFGELVVGPKYYAYEILVHRDAYSGAPEDLIKYDKNTYDAQKSDYYFVNFIIAQELLKDAGFYVIPYEIINNGEGLPFGEIELPQFRSLILDHSDEDRTEGYVLRYETTDREVWFCYKFKSEKYLARLSGGKKVGEIHPSINENTWNDFMSKYDYWDIDLGRILLEFADDIDDLERTPQNYATLKKFVLEKFGRISSETFQKFKKSEKF